MSPGVFLLLGLIFSSLVPKARSNTLSRYGKLALGWAIVGLGATVKISAVYDISRSSLLITIVSIAFTILLAWVFGALFGISPALRALIGSGTAICGASAIAAVGGAIKARNEEMTVALGVILLFNTIALFLFPWLGGALALSSDLFAQWAGLAIHDTSSVVGAAIAYDPTSAQLATTVKLARAVWIAPLVLLFSAVLTSSTSRRISLPWFLWGFIGASLLCSLLQPAETLLTTVQISARWLFAAALFLIGLCTDLKLVIAAGPKPLILGLLVWGAAAALTLVWIY